jgi:hypothetical protein
MSRGLPDLLRIHRLRLKADWLQRLRARPPKSSLAMPEILRHRMNDTLDQLDDLLRSPAASRWRLRPAPGWAELHEQCRCGQNPLLDYFELGGATLAEVLAAELGADEMKAVEGAWHFLAAREILALCGVCRRPCSPVLQLPVPAGAL